MKSYKLQPYWYLGFLALIGVWHLPEVWAYVAQGQGAWHSLLGLLWFGWAFNFLPEVVDIDRDLD